MTLALYQVLTPYALTVNSGDITGQYPVSLSVPSGGFFVGNTADPLLVSLVAANALASSAPGMTTPPRFELFTQTP